jgi:hypothetical protein
MSFTPPYLIRRSILSFRAAARQASTTPIRDPAILVKDGQGQPGRLQGFLQRGYQTGLNDSWPVTIKAFLALKHLGFGSDFSCNDLRRKKNAFVHSE